MKNKQVYSSKRCIRRNRHKAKKFYKEQSEHFKALVLEKPITATEFLKMVAKYHMIAGHRGWHHWYEHELWAPNVQLDITEC